MSHLPLDHAVLRSICEILAATGEGLTNKEIDELLAEASIDDPNPQPDSPNLYRSISKRDRLFAALAQRQKRDGSASGVYQFIELAMRPVRFRSERERFAHWSDALNETLSFASVGINEQGRLVKLSSPAGTLDDARRRARRLRGKLEDRGVHPRVLSACGAEINDENYFHAVFEATKSVAEEIRQKSGLRSDGRQLVDKAFGLGDSGIPRLAFNRLVDQTDRSEHQGFADLLRGLFAGIRNPTAHRPKVVWKINEQDALDRLSFVSMLHRQLDSCFLVPGAENREAA